MASTRVAPDTTETVGELAPYLRLYDPARGTHNLPGLSGKAACAGSPPPN
jgi:hypothetical protein